VGDKNMYYNGKYKGQMVNGVPMGDPLTKTNLSLAHPICDRYAKLKLGRKVISMGVGNGDDGNRIAAGPDRHKYFEYFLEGATLLGYKRSDLDTFVTQDWGTYCEEVFRFPIDRFHTVKNANRLKDSRISPYLDHPKGRLIIDTKKDRQDYSSDPKGKYTLLGKELEYVAKDSQTGINFLYSVSSACQDVGLGLRDRPEPVFLPRQIFGSGKIAPNWDVHSWHKAILSQRRWCKNVIAEVMREAIGELKPNITELRGVVRDTTHFEKEGIVETLTIPEDHPIKKYRVVKREETSLFPPGTLEQLQRNKVLVPETEVKKYYLFHERMAALDQVSTNGADLFEVLKVTALVLKDYTDGEVLEIVGKFVKKFKDAPWLLRYNSDQDLYPEELISILAQSDPLRVRMPEFRYLQRFRKRPKPDSPYQREVATLSRWFDNNYEDVIAGRTFELPPVNIIEDDPIILLNIQRMSEKLIIIVTDDRKLARLAARKFPSKIIGRIAIVDWVFHSMDYTGFKTAIHVVMPVTVEILVDQGSLETYMETKLMMPMANYSLGISVSDPLQREWSGDVWRLPPITQAQIYKNRRPRARVSVENVLDKIEILSKMSSTITRAVYNPPINDR
jgi:hypothetical protein